MFFMKWNLPNVTAQKPAVHLLQIQDSIEHFFNHKVLGDSKHFEALL